MESRLRQLSKRWNLGRKSKSSRLLRMARILNQQRFALPNPRFTIKVLSWPLSLIYCYHFLILQLSRVVKSHHKFMLASYMKQIAKVIALLHHNASFYTFCFIINNKVISLPHIILNYSGECFPLFRVLRSSFCLVQL